ncbi:MAG: hypothetical protein IK093_10875 [Ruminiclostridium sp.]|nr:hypothetical protein [Ruminiclostridium sp.]
MNRSIKRTVAAIIAAGLVSSVAAVPVSADDNRGSVTLALSSSSKDDLAAPSNIRTSMSKGAMTVKWSKVSGASAYKVEVKYPGKKYTTLKTVKGTKVKIPYLKNGDKVSVRITSLKKSSIGYSKGKSSTVTKTFKCEKLYLDENNVFGIDTSLMGMSLSQIEKALGQELELMDWTYWDRNPYVTYPMIDDDHVAAVFFDKNKKVDMIMADLPVDEYNGGFINSLKSTYSSLEKADYDWTDFYYYCDIDDKTGLEVFQEFYSGGDNDTVLRQAFFLK